jgi:Domain of unknown function (DUF6457)
MAQEEFGWLDRLTSTLGEPPLEREEIGGLLRLARGVARASDRKLAPLTTFVAGVHVGRRTAEGASREEAQREVVEAIRTISPDYLADTGPAGPGRGGGRGRGRRRRGWFRR